MGDHTTKGLVLVGRVDQVIQRASDERIGIEEQHHVRAEVLLEPGRHGGTEAESGELGLGDPTKLDAIGGQPRHPLGQTLIDPIGPNARDHGCFAIGPAEPPQRVGQAAELIQEGRGW